MDISKPAVFRGRILELHENTDNKICYPFICNSFKILLDKVLDHAGQTMLFGGKAGLLFLSSLPP